MWTSLREKGSGNDGDVERVRDRKNFIGSQGEEMDDGEMGRIRSSATTWGRKGRQSLLWWDQQAGCARIYFEPLANLVLTKRAVGRNRRQLRANFPLSLVATWWD